MNELYVFTGINVTLISVLVFIIIIIFIALGIMVNLKRRR